MPHFNLSDRNVYISALRLQINYITRCFFGLLLLNTSTCKSLKTASLLFDLDNSNISIVKQLFILSISWSLRRIFYFFDCGFEHPWGHSKSVRRLSSCTFYVLTPQIISDKIPHCVVCIVLHSSVHVKHFWAELAAHNCGLYLQMLDCLGQLRRPAESEHFNVVLLDLWLCVVSNSVSEVFQPGLFFLLHPLRRLLMSESNLFLLSRHQLRLVVFQFVLYRSGSHY